jgi:hypothetical protein
MDHEAQGQRQQQERDVVCPATDQRVQNVPAVELPDRHQVQSGNQDSDPAGKQPGIRHHIIMLGDGPMDQAHQPLKD